uniref:Zgc:113276 n=1 Tax=Salarias fasciatus TaxID=181472 RepID=A0A672GK27_SALFA
MVILDVIIIGGGPHALTLASLLSSHECDPECHTPNFPSHSHAPRSKSVGFCDKSLQRPVAPPLSLCVVDTYGEWTALWESQFTALNIPHLRSHTLVHTDPLNKKALQEFVLKHQRSAELHSLPDQVYILDENAFFNDMRLGKKERRRLNVTSTLRKSSAFSLPGAKLSVDFFKEQVCRYKLEKVLVKGTVERITPVMEDNEEMEEEEEEEAHQVVVATGPTRAQMANIPMWVQNIAENYPEGHLQHTVHLMHHLPNTKQKESFSTAVCQAGQRVMVVGGGLTSAHVVSIAIQQGASRVTWVMRKHLQLKQFDVGDVESLVGRYSHVEHGIKMDGQAYLRQFYNERSLHRRLAMIRQARKGGAVTPEAYMHLQPFIVNGQVEVKTYCQVSEASWCYKNQAWHLCLSTGECWSGDMIWLATGCKLDVKQDPLLSEVMQQFPIQVIDGWPCISESLQWAEGCRLYLMGQYTALQIGPHAVNLAGGQAASMRIAKDIMRRHDWDGSQMSKTSGEKTKTEEYVQQMHGLLWL